MNCVISFPLSTEIFYGIFYGLWEPAMYVRSDSKKYKRNSPSGEGGRNPIKKSKKISPKISYDFFTFYNALSH